MSAACDPAESSPNFFTTPNRKFSGNVRCWNASTARTALSTGLTFWGSSSGGSETAAMAKPYPRDQGSTPARTIESSAASDIPTTRLRHGAATISTWPEHQEVGIFPTCDSKEFGELRGL